MGEGRLLLAVLLTAAWGCEDETTPQIFIARCVDDRSCGEGEVCIDGECIPRDALSCTAIDGGAAILQPGPPLIEFGHVGNGTSERPLVLRNIGDCTLTVFEAYFETEDQTVFMCPFCSPDRFPIDLFPFRQHELKVFFTPQEVGSYEDALILLSDDTEFPEIKIPVRARFDGLPEPVAVPESLDFDYAPVGRTLSKTVEIQNRGTGSAPLIISRIEIETSTPTAFSFEPELLETLTLPPVSMDRSANHVLNVRYHPKEIESHVADLVAHTNAGALRIPLLGSSQTPASISVSPERIEFGPVPIGQTTALPLTIVNEGGTPLHVTFRWGGVGLSTDLSALPQVVAPIAPGSYTELQVLVTATSPTPITGLLLLETNDPAHPTVTVPVSADGQDVIGAQVIKIDMNFENGEDSFFDDDFRNVDMTFENPFGLICNKQNASPANWGAFGNPSWIAFGPKEEPERIVLPDAMQDGTYRVALSYYEDCSSVPSGLVASILGISVEALIAYLSGGTVPIDGGDVADVIADLCLDHSSSAATITVFVNGQIIAERPVTLGRKGDFVYAVDLVRTNGTWTAP
jgi:hypothetical protein